MELIVIGVVVLVALGYWILSRADQPADVVKSTAVEPVVTEAPVVETVAPVQEPAPADKSKKPAVKKTAAPKTAGKKAKTK